MRRTAVVTSVLAMTAAGVVAAPQAQAAGFCADKVAGTSRYQHNFRHNGSVVATLCAPLNNRAGNATLYARGPYTSVQKYMKIVVRTTQNGGTTKASADGQFYERVYRYRPAGLHDYRAVMFDGKGNKIVDTWVIDYE